MKVHVYYWKAADRIVAISYGRIIDLLGGNCFTIEKTRSRVAKLKTLVYLGEL